MFVIRPTTNTGHFNMTRINKISITQKQIVLQDQLKHHRNRSKNQKGAIEQTVDDGDSSDDCVDGDGVGAVMTMIQQSLCHLEQLRDIQAGWNRTVATGRMYSEV
jgi:hypothetical protein